MKKIALLVLALTWGTMAASMRIGHVDSKYLFENYKIAKVKQKEFEKKIGKWEQEVATLQKDLSALKEKLQKQSLMLSKEKKKELEAKFLKQKTEYEQMVAKKFGREGDYMKMNEEMSAPLIKKIKKVIQDVASKEGYDMVLDRASGAVLYWKSDYDITSQVLTILNQE